MTTALTMTCPECKGQGGWFTDEWGPGGHYTKDRACESCEGTGEVPARCECGGPAEVPNSVSDTCWMCRECSAMSNADHVPTPALGVETMATVVSEGLR